jgi:ATP phosphoribosyltransferase regulatory subunit
MQVGLECIGAVDAYAVYEVLLLALQSLRCISPDCILEVSHVGLLTDLLHQWGVSADDTAVMLKCIGEKNLHELAVLGEKAQLSPEAIASLKAIASASGKPAEVLPLLSSVLSNEETSRFSEIVSRLEKEDVADNLRINFSVVDDIHYYNGIVFKGYIAGVPSAVLSGGQYDKLMQKMNRRSGAVGFAVYVDLLERLSENTTPYDVDVVLLYDETVSLDTLSKQVFSLTEEGNRVLATKECANGVRYKTMMKIVGNEVVVLETYA